MDPVKPDPVKSAPKVDAPPEPNCTPEVASEVLAAALQVISVACTTNLNVGTGTDQHGILKLHSKAVKLVEMHFDNLIADLAEAKKATAGK
jgi:hypothetical protein